MNGIRRVLIVGGGSSGWMTAALLRQRLPSLEISLIESSDVPTLGVGESTNLSVRHFHRLIGIEERPFMRAANAAFKIAIRFDGFSRPGASFFHPFGKPIPAAAGWFKPGAESHFPTYQLVRNGNLFSQECAYSYQLDAGLYGQFLKERCKRQQVAHIVDHVRDIELDTEGGIRALHTTSGRSLTADLYVDCSGFRAALLEGALHEPFVPAVPWLLNDRAVAGRFPYEDKSAELRTYTNCTALSSGWVWQIPLWSRLGVGYVYSSAFLSDDAAEDELRGFLGRDRVKEIRFNRIRIRTGRHERAWVKNCVAVGVSFGILEPLESTGLSLTQIAILDLEKALAQGANSLARHWFNRRCTEIFDTTRDFVAAHFVLTQREDTPYWRHIRYANAIPDSLGDVIERAGGDHSFKPIEGLRNTFYEKLNWNVILSGMGLFDQERAVAATCAPPVGTVPHASVLERAIHNDDSGVPEATEMADHFPGIQPLDRPTLAPTW